MREEFGGYWLWVRADQDAPYEISGKYLFFSEDREQLLRIAREEIAHHGFHEAKVNRDLLPGQTEHVLCLYFSDDSRKRELEERNRTEYKVKYRYWKSATSPSAWRNSQELWIGFPA